MLPVKADLVILSRSVWSVAFMLSKMDFSSCTTMLGFRKSHLVTPVEYFQKSCMFEDTCMANLRVLHARLWS